MTRLTGLPELTTVLLPESVPMRPFETEDGRRGMVRDLSYLEFAVEALIAQSAVRLAVCPASSFYDDFSFLPHALRSRIVKVDTNSEAYEKAFAVLLPVITEHGIKISGEASVFESTSEMDSRITNALCRALIDLRRLLVGITHRCQVPLDPAAMLSAIDVLRASVTTPDARGNLAAIEGILNAYEPLATPSLHVRHGIEIDRVRAFSRFASDETYRAMSHEAGLLGIPAKATLAVLGMRRKCAELLARPKVADLDTQRTSARSAHFPAARRHVEAVASTHITSVLISRSRHRFQRRHQPERRFPPLVLRMARHSRQRHRWAGVPKSPARSAVYLRSVSATGAVCMRSRIPRTAANTSEYSPARPSVFGDFRPCSLAFAVL
jgi:hypothetical protein